jgi:hypothetical protein
MRKAIASTLAVAFFLSAFLLLPQSSWATRADACYDDWGGCRSRAFESDEGIIRTALMLTVCDVALGKCLLGFTRI